MAFPRLERDIESWLDRRRGLTDNEEFESEVAEFFRENALKEPNFKGSSEYSEKEIQKDLNDVERMKKSPDYVAERKSEPVAFEYAIMGGLKIRGWFGDEVGEVRKTAEYDDIMHGVDMVVIFEDPEGKPVYLGIDATTSQDRMIVERKIGRLLDRCRRKQLTEVKYFEDLKDEKHPIRVPLVVLGQPPGEVRELQDLFVKAKIDKKAQRHLDEHPLQLWLLDMVERQLLHFMGYALRAEGILVQKSRLRGVREVEQLLMDREKEISADPALESFLYGHLQALRAIARAKKEKRPLGEISSERADEVTRFLLLESPEQWERLER